MNLNKPERYSDQSKESSFKAADVSKRFVQYVA